MGSYENIAVRDASGQIAGYQNVQSGQFSPGTGSINYVESALPPVAQSEQLQVHTVLPQFKSVSYDVVQKTDAAVSPQTSSLPTPFVSKPVESPQPVVSALPATEPNPQMDRLQSVFQAIGQGTDTTLSFITTLGGRSPGTAFTPFKDLNERTGLSASNQELDSHIMALENTRAQQKTQMQSYDIEAASKSLAEEKASLDLRAAPVAAQNEYLANELKSIESARSKLDLTNAGAVDDLNLRIADYNRNSAALASSSKDLQGAIDIHNQNVAAFTERVGNLQSSEQAIKALELSALKAGALEIQDGKVVVSPLVERPYGAFSDWSKGASEYMLSSLGLTRQQVLQSSELYKGDSLKSFEIGAFKQIVLSPGDVVAAGISGAQLAALGGGISALGRLGVATAAESGLPAISTAGRALSTPLASDIGKVVGVGVGLGLLFNAYAGKTAEQAGSTSVLIGAGAAGALGVSPAIKSAYAYQPENKFAGRTLSGELGIGPLEQTQFKIETGLHSLFAEDRGAYKEVSNIVLPVRVIEPTVKAEPQFETLSKSGPYANEIKATITEQPHSVIGSSSFIQQYPKDIATEAGIRIGKDVDVLIEKPQAALESLSAKTGLSVEGSKNVLDVHPFPENYPGVKGSPASDVIAEASIRPGAKGYRAAKDIYDFITAYQAQREVGIRSGKPESYFAASDKAMKSFMEREITFGTQKEEAAPNIITRMFGDPYRRIALPRSTSEIITPKDYAGVITYEAAQVQTGRKAAGVAAAIEYPGKENAVTMKISDIYEQMKSENIQNLKKYYAGEELRGTTERADRYRSAGAGYIGSLFRDSSVPPRASPSGESKESVGSASSLMKSDVASYQSPSSKLAKYPSVLASSVVKAASASPPPGSKPPSPSVPSTYNPSAPSKVRPSPSYPPIPSVSGASYPGSPSPSSPSPRSSSPASPSPRSPTSPTPIPFYTIPLSYSFVSYPGGGGGAPSGGRKQPAGKFAETFYIGPSKWIIGKPPMKMPRGNNIFRIPKRRR